MPDIFISYKKEERETASTLATRLTEAGYEVWWDDALLAGERYEDEIASVIDKSGAVVVLWSRQSIKSEWVKAEADAARQQKKAFPVIIDDMSPTQMPLLYRGMHAARLEGWKGEVGHEGYVELIGSIRDRIGRAKGPELTAKQAEEKLAETATEAVRTIVANTAAPKPAAPVSRRSPLRWIAGAVVLVLLALGSTFAYLQLNTIPEADLAATARCTAWSTSGRLDWRSGLPRLDPTTDTDCEIAARRYPDNGSYLGMQAMVRVLQGRTDEAIALANRAIDKRGATGYLALGSLYEHGLGLTADLTRAITNYKAASGLGLLRATGELCILAIDFGGMFGLSTSPLEIIGWCNTASEGGDVLGQIGTAYLFESNYNGQSVDPAKAAALYQAAVDQGSDEAAVRLGILYHRGSGVAQDFGRAVSLYRQAADHGEPSGLRSLAISLELGDGIQQNLQQAAQYYESASAAGDIPALLLAGYGIAPNAIITTRLTADLNSLASPPNIVTAHRLRSQLFARGILRAQDVKQAESELLTCNTVNNPFCLYALGYFYEFGVNGTRDPAKALPLYQASADQGNLYGQYWLAYMYDAGDGVPRDQDKAIQYYKLAAAQGHLTSKNRLAQLGQPVP